MLFVDFFQPGLELLYYYLESSSIKIKIGSLFHGANFVPHDFFNKFPWMKNFDRGLIDLMEAIYVSSEAAKRYFPDKEKVKVFEYAFNPREYNCAFNNKKYDVIIPHRWSWEKNPKLYKKIIKDMPEITFAISGFGEFSGDKKLKKLFLEVSSYDNVINLGVKNDKEHKEDLTHAKVVLGTQDLFGYSVREAISSGCIPVCINDFAYPEFLGEKYLFDDEVGAKEKISSFVKNYPNNYPKIIETKFDDIINNFYEN